jgi:hypothetical protein
MGNIKELFELCKFKIRSWEEIEYSQTPEWLKEKFQLSRSKGKGFYHMAVNPEHYEDEEYEYRIEMKIHGHGDYEYMFFRKKKRGKKK